MNEYLQVIEKKLVILEKITFQNIYIIFNNEYLNVIEKYIIIELKKHNY